MTTRCHSFAAAAINQKKRVKTKIKVFSLTLRTSARRPQIQFFHRYDSSLFFIKESRAVVLRSGYNQCGIEVHQEKEKTTVTTVKEGSLVGTNEPFYLHKMLEEKFHGQFPVRYTNTCGRFMFFGDQDSSAKIRFIVLDYAFHYATNPLFDGKAHEIAQGF